MEPKIELIMKEVISELNEATEKFGSFNNRHEGLALIREEYLELEKEIFKKDPSKDKMTKEAIQLAAVAIRFVHDVSL